MAIGDAFLVAGFALIQLCVGGIGVADMVSQDVSPTFAIPFWAAVIVGIDAALFWMLH